MEIGLRHLRYVIAAFTCGSFRCAAASLGVQQSAISRHIRNLEDEIGAALFIRHAGGVTPTHAGTTFVRHAREALGEVSRAVADIRPIGRGEEGVLRIGIISSLASGFLSQLLRTYINQYRNVRFDISEGAQSEHITAVRLHKLDVAFVTGSPDFANCDAAELWSEGVFVVLPRDHALAEAECVRWDDLREEAFIISEGGPGPDIHNFLINRLANLGVRPWIETHRLGRDNLMQIVSLGRGVTLTSEATIATRFPGVVYRRLQGETLPFCAVWSPSNDNPAWRRMLSLARLTAQREKRCAVDEAKCDPTSTPRWVPSSRQASAAPSQTPDPSP